MSDRRAFLKSLGVVVPAFPMAARATHSVLDYAPRQTGGATDSAVSAAGFCSPEDVFEIYVAEALRILQERGVSTIPDGLVRMTIEAQGAALAMVLAHLQNRSVA
jgi:hypothetical protein